MSYNDKMNVYVNIIKNTINLYEVLYLQTPYEVQPDGYVPPDTEPTIDYEDNLGKKELLGVINDLEMLSGLIGSTVNVLFDDPDAIAAGQFGTYTHFSILNAYADACENIEEYILGTENFIIHNDYFYTRGQYYELVAAAIQGNFLDNGINDIDKITNECLRLQKEWEIYSIPPVPEPTPENPKPVPVPYTPEELKELLKSFWEEHIVDFQNFISDNASTFAKVNYEFNRLYNEVYDYKNLYTTVFSVMALGEIFFNAEKKKVDDSSNRNLLTPFNELGYHGLLLINPLDTKQSIAEAYNIFTTAKEYRRIYFPDDPYDIYLRKIYKSLYFTSKNFGFIDPLDGSLANFLKMSEYLYGNILDIRKTLNI